MPDSSNDTIAAANRRLNGFIDRYSGSYGPVPSMLQRQQSYEEGLQELEDKRSVAFNAEEQRLANKEQEKKAKHNRFLRSLGFPVTPPKGNTP